MSVVGLAKQCRVCGSELDGQEWGGGMVWACGTHGVRDWLFGAEPPSIAPRSLVRHGPLPPTPAPAPADAERGVGRC